MEIGKEYIAKCGFPVIPISKNGLMGGEFLCKVYTNKKKNFGHQVVYLVPYSPSGSCRWPAFPEYDIKFPEN